MSPNTCPRACERGIKPVDGIKAVNQVTSKQETVLEEPGGPAINTRVLKSGRARRKEIRGGDSGHRSG